MAVKEKLKDFSVTARIVVNVSTKIRAKNLTDAVELSKDLGIEDFITVPQEGHNDSSLNIVGLSDEEGWFCD